MDAAKRRTYLQWIDTFQIPRRALSSYIWDSIQPSRWPYPCIEYTHHFVNEIDSVLYERTKRQRDTKQPLMRTSSEHELSNKVSQVEIVSDEWLRAVQSGEYIF